MNYATMKRVFRRGGIITIRTQPAVASLKEMFALYPIGKRGRNIGGLRFDLLSAESFVPQKPGVNAEVTA